jgi:hypothetical protein
MHMSWEQARAELHFALMNSDQLVRAVASGRRRGFQPEWRRVEVRPIDIKAGRRIQVVRLDERQAHTTNLDSGEWLTVIDELLDAGFGHWHVDTSDEQIQLRVTKKGEALVHRGKPSEVTEQMSTSHDRVKARRLNPENPDVERFLVAVGIADAQGRIKPSRQDKYRQIEEFVRVLDASVNDALIAGSLVESSAEKPWQLVDLGCGNAYLTMAAYVFLACVRGEHVRVHGVDVREDSYRRNSELAAKLGIDAHVTFEAAYISDASDRAADVVLALHACDTATDDALARAVQCSASVVLASPCCHHDLQRQIGTRAPEPYGLLTGSGILRERFIDVLTDSIRAELLRCVGYRVDVIEYVSDEHTNRNLMIRAIKTGAPPRRQDLNEYDALIAGWAVEPRLARLIAGEIASGRNRVGA